jgi:hypothetical protein
MAEFLPANQAQVVDTWSELAASNSGGRISPADLRRELEEIFALTCGRSPNR